MDSLVYGIELSCFSAHDFSTSVPSLQPSEAQQNSLHQFCHAIGLDISELGVYSAFRGDIDCYESIPFKASVVYGFLSNSLYLIEDVAQAKYGQCIQAWSSAKNGYGVDAVYGVHDLTNTGDVQRLHTQMKTHGLDTSDCMFLCVLEGVRIDPVYQTRSLSV
jgi:hypothetical protein